MKKKILSLLLCMALCLSMSATFAGCKGSKKADAFVIMTEQLDGLFNPFFYTSSYDGTIVSMTQIGMMGSKYENGEAVLAYGEDEAVVTLDYEMKNNGDDTYSYYFVLKNGIKFSDGHPLTMEDVLFNYYVYLDPVYTGSNTLYSTDIVGLQEYRTQKTGGSDSDYDEMISAEASNRASMRIMELYNLYVGLQKNSATGEVSYDTMKAAIMGASVSSDYQAAISADPSSVTNEQLLKDYDYALKLFMEELNGDFDKVKDSYTDGMYKDHEEFKDQIFCFMYAYGFVDVKHPIGADGKEDDTVIESMTKKYDGITTKEQAVEKVYNAFLASNLPVILMGSMTASKLQTEYTAKAKEVILRESVASDGELAVPNIAGIVSLGHTEEAGSTIQVNGKDYKVASEHNADGTVKGEGYDVLKITIDGVDPKAMWNFCITVAPQHYYGEGSKVGVDIANNKFGVEYASFDFMTNVVQSARNIKLPMGAGSYKCTDSKNSDKPSESGFYTNNVVYFKRNDCFETVGAGIENAKIEKIRYQVISSNNAIAALQDGTVHYISPQMTAKNYEDLQKMGKKGIKILESAQLGYGYIGINAAKINDINLRRAIMCAMDTSQAIGYYRANTAQQICWNMSTVSWAYPKGEDANYNGKDYPQMGTFSQDAAVTNIKKYMEAANASAGDSRLKVTFTIAGSSLQDHPTYKVFRDAADMLNGLGWEIDVVCDSLALTKINTGALQVWAAAWSSALDPDMYQVYHKNSTATSTLAWGYNYLRNSNDPEEITLLNDLSDLIDAARETDDRNSRSELYKEAMGLILDLAVELPVYQRNVLYAYNSKVIKSATMPTEADMNPYSSPLDRIWEIEFA